MPRETGVNEQEAEGSHPSEVRVLHPGLGSAGFRHGTHRWERGQMPCSRDPDAPGACVTRHPRPRRSPGTSCCLPGAHTPGRGPQLAAQGSPNPKRPCPRQTGALGDQATDEQSQVRVGAPGPQTQPDRPFPRGGHTAGGKRPTAPGPLGSAGGSLRTRPSPCQRAVETRAYFKG